jgi:tRNA 2-thiouridine synthesizing protein A
MLARNRLRGMARGEVLCILATDPTTERDFKDLCRFMGHVLVSAEHTAGEYHYWIRKA